MLSQKQLQDICLLFIGDHRQCRYLQEDPQQWQWFCVKHKKSAKDRIDSGLESFYEECAANGIKPNTVPGVAQGDNCKGFPIFKNLMQGYDCP
jgi:hypothetical protein